MPVPEPKKCLCMKKDQGNPTSGKTLPSSEGPMGRKRAYTILLVEPNPSMQEVTHRIIEMLGYKAKASSSVEEGLEAYRKGGIDLVIGAYARGLGLELVKGVRSQDADARIIITTGGMGRDEYMELEGAGAAEVLVSPFSPTELDGEIGTHLRPRAESEKEPAAPKKKTCTVLVVDDEEQIIKAGVRICESIGHKAKSTTSSDEALEIFKAGGVDLVLSDFRMPPGMNGLELLKALKEHDPSVKVIIYAGGLKQSEVEALKEAGVVDIVAKPAGISELKEVIKSNI